MAIHKKRTSSTWSEAHLASESSQAAFPLTSTTTNNCYTAMGSSVPFPLGTTGTTPANGSYVISLTDGSLKLYEGELIPADSKVTIAFWAISPAANQLGGYFTSGIAENTPEDNDPQFELQAATNSGYSDASRWTSDFFRRSSTTMLREQYTALSTQGMIWTGPCADNDGDYPDNYPGFGNTELPRYLDSDAATRIMHHYIIELTIPTGGRYLRFRGPGGNEAQDHIFLYSLKMIVTSPVNTKLGSASTNFATALGVDTYTNIVNDNSKVYLMLRGNTPTPAANYTGFIEGSATVHSGISGRSNADLILRSSEALGAPTSSTQSEYILSEPGVYLINLSVYFSSLASTHTIQIGYDLNDGATDDDWVLSANGFPMSPATFSGSKIVRTVNHNSTVKFWVKCTGGSATADISFNATWADILFMGSTPS